MKGPILLVGTITTPEMVVSKKACMLSKKLALDLSLLKVAPSPWEGYNKISHWKITIFQEGVLFLLFTWMRLRSLTLTGVNIYIG